MRRTIVRGVLALVVAVVAGLVLLHMTVRPKLASVLIVKKVIAAGKPIAKTDLGKMTVIAPRPHEALTSASQAVGLVAQVPLYPGQTITRADIGKNFGGVPDGMVKLVVPVTAGQSALAKQGSHVDLLGMIKKQNGTVTTQAVVLGATVLGVYSQAGGPVVTSGHNARAPALVALAVSPSQAQSVLPYLTTGSSYWLVLDPSGSFQAAGLSGG